MSGSVDSRIVRLIVERCGLTREQVDAALREPAPVELVLVEKGLLSPAQAADLLTALAQDAGPGDAGRAVDWSIARIAVEHGFAAREPVHRALRERWAAAAGGASPGTFTDLLVARGVLNATRAMEVERLHARIGAGADDAQAQTVRVEPPRVDATVVRSAAFPGAEAAPPEKIDVTSVPSVAEGEAAGTPSRPAPAETALPARRKLAKYDIVAELGRGGMGVVYKAWHPGLRTHFALKVLLGGDTAPAEAILRFRKEAQAAARLRHPGIIAVHDIGEEEGKSFIAMEYVEGETLDKVLADPRAHGIDTGGAAVLATAEAVRITAEIAEAVQAAHDAGVIHRDLKPANVMRERSGRLKVMDFGLAKLIDTGDSGVTRTGTLMGTPAYMSPEQAEGRTKEIDARSDVYQIGAILYEALTGRRPFDGQTSMAILVKVLQEDPAPPRKFNPRVDAAVETICLKAMAREKSRRYATARELAEDCRRWLAGEAILARPETRREKLVRWVRRRKKLTAMAGAALLALAVAGFTVAEKRALEREVLEGVRGIAASNLKAILLVRRTGGRMREMQASFLQPLEDSAHRAIAQAPGLAEPHYHLGRIYRALFREADALAEQERALAKEPDYAPSRFEHAILLLRRLDRRALQLRERWLNEEGRRLRQGGALAQGGLGGAEVREAPPILELIQADGPARTLHHAVSDDLARLEGLAAAGRPDLAPWMVDGVRGLLLIYRPADDPSLDEVQRCLRQAREGDPYFEDAYDGLARVDCIRGRIEEAIQVHDQAIEMDKGYVPFFLGRGDEYLSLAVRSERRGQDPEESYRKSEADFVHAADLDPDSAPAWSGRALTQMRWGTYKSDHGQSPESFYRQADEALDQAIRLGPDAADAFQRRGALRGNWGIWARSQGQDPSADWQKSLAAYDRALALDPRDSLLWMERALVRGNWAEHRSWSGQDPLPDYLAAEQDATKALECAPDAADAWQMRGLLYMNWSTALDDLGQDPEPMMAKSLADYDHAVQLKPGAAWNWLSRGGLRVNWGYRKLMHGEDPSMQFAAAAADLAEAEKLNPNEARIWTTKGDLQADEGLLAQRRGDDPSGSYGKAAESYRRSLELNANDAGARLRRGKMLANWAFDRAERGGPSDDLFRQAEADMDEAVRLNPGEAGAWMGRADVRLARGTVLAIAQQDPSQPFAGAEADYSEALARNPKLGGAWMKRGNLRVNWANAKVMLGQDAGELFAAAEADCGKAAELNPGSSSAYSMRGNVRANWAEEVVAAGGDPQPLLRGAEEDYGKTIELDPGTTDGRIRRGDLRLFQADRAAVSGGSPEALTQAAREDYEEAVRRAPGSAEALGRRAWARQAQGDWSGAAADAAGALKLNPACEPQLLVTPDAARRAERATAVAGLGPQWLMDVVRGEREIFRHDYAGAGRAYAAGLKALRDGLAALPANERARVDADPDLRVEARFACFNHACTLAVASEGKSAPKAAPKPIDAATAARLIDEAFVELAEVLRLDWDEPDAFEREKDFAALHADPRWAPLVERAKRGK